MDTVGRKRRKTNDVNQFFVQASLCVCVCVCVGMTTQPSPPFTALVHMHGPNSRATHGVLSDSNNFAHLDVKTEAWQHRSVMHKHFAIIPDPCVLFYFYILYAIYMYDEHIYTRPNGKIPFPRLFFSILKNFAHLDVKTEA